MRNHKRCNGNIYNLSPRVAHWIKHAKEENVISFTIAVEKVYVDR